MPVNPICTQDDIQRANERVAQLEGLIQDSLRDEGCESVELFMQAYEKSRAEYQAFVDKNQANCKQALRLAELNAQYQNVVDMLNELEQVKNAIIQYSQNPVEATDSTVIQETLTNKLAQLQQMLAEEGGDHVTRESTLTRYTDLSNQLTELESKGAGTSKAANRVRNELNDLEQIKNLIDEIVLLEQQIQGSSLSVGSLVHAEGSPSEVILEQTEILQQSIEITPIVVGATRIIDIDYKHDTTTGGEPLSVLIPRPGALAGSAQDNDAIAALSQLQNKFSFMLDSWPDFSEKSLTLLRLYFDYEDLVIKSEQEIPSLFPQELLIVIFEKLKYQLQEEGLKDKKLSLQLNQFKDRLNQYVPKDKVILNEIIQELSGLMTMVQPVDIDYMLELIQKTKSAASNLDGQEVYVLFGVTGSGKSTTAHVMGGSNFEEVKTKKRKQLKPIPTDPQLETFITSSLARSETSVINSARINLSRVASPLTGEVTICDTPGFGDTRGVVIDMVNGICLVDAISQACRIKPIVIISKNGIGDRCQGLRDLVSTLVQLMPTIATELPAFSYIFTKYPTDEYEEIHPTLEEVLEDTLRDKKGTTPAFIALLKDMVDKTRESALTLDPRRERADKLYNAMKNTPFIERPKECFQTFTSSDSLDKLRDQLNKIIHLFKKALRTGQGDLASYKFKQILQLKNELGLVPVVQSYEEMLEEIQTLFSYLKQQITDRLKRISMDGNTEISDDLALLVDEINYLCHFDQLREEMSEQNTNLIQWAELGLTRFVKTLKSNIVSEYEVIKDVLQTPELITQAKSLLPSNGVVNLNKMQQIDAIMNHFRYFTPEYVLEIRNECQEVIGFFRTLFNEYHRLSGLAFERNHFDAFSIFTSQLKTLLNDYGICFDASYHQQYQNILDKIEQSINFAYQAINSQFIEMYNPERSLQVAEIIFQYNLLASMRTDPGMHLFCDLAAIEKGIDELNIKIQTYFAYIEDVIVTNLLQNFTQNSCTQVNFMMASIERLMSSLHLMLILAPFYNRIVNKVETFLHAEFVRAEIQLRNIAQNPFSYNIALPYDEILSASQVIAIASGLQSGAFEQHTHGLLPLKNMLLDFYEKVLPNVKPISIEPEFINQLPGFLNTIHKLHYLTPIEQVLITDSSPGKDVVTRFGSELRAIMQKASEFANSDTMVVNTESFLTALAFLFPFAHLLTGPLVEDIHELMRRLYASYMQQLAKKLDSLMQASTTILIVKSENKANLLSYLDEVFKYIQIANYLQSELKILTWVHKLKLDDIKVMHERLFGELTKGFVDYWTLPPQGLFVKLLQSFESAVDKISAGTPDHNGTLKIEVAKKMSVLSECCPHLVREFSQVSLRLEHAIRTQMTGVINELKIVASQKDYAAFKDLYTRILASQPELSEGVSAIFNEVIGEISSQLASLSDRLAGLKLSSKTQSALLSILQEADAISKSSVLLEMAGHEKLETLKASLNQVTNRLNGILEEFFLRVEPLIKSGDYIEAAKRIKFIEGILPAIASNSGRGDELDSRCKGFYNQIRNAVAQKNSDFNTQSVEDYSKTLPNEYLKQLEQLAQVESEYDQFAQQLREALKTNILRSIEECKQETPGFDVDGRLKIITESHPYIPVEIYGDIKLVLDETQLEITHKKETEQQLLLQLTRDRDMRGLVSQLVNTYNQERMKVLSYEILTIMRGSEQTFKIAIANSNLKDIIVPFMRAWKDWQYYRFEIQTRRVVVAKSYRYFDVIGHILDPNIPQAMCDDMLARVNAEYEKLCQGLSLLPTLSASARPLAMRMVQTHIDLLSQLIEMAEDRNINKHTYYTPAKHLLDSLHALNANWSNNKFNQMVDQCMVVFIAHQQNVVSAIMNNAFTELADLLALSEEFQTTLDRLQIMAKNHFYEVKHPDNAQKILACDSYANLRTKLGEEIVRLKEVASTRILEHAQAKSSNAIERKEFYSRISTAYCSFKTIRALSKHVDPATADVNVLEATAYDKICANLAEVYTFIETVLLSKIPSHNKELLTELNTWYDNLVTAREEFKETNLANETSILTRRVSTRLVDTLDDLLHRIVSNVDFSTLLNDLLYFKMISCHAPIFKKMTDDMIEKILRHVKSMRNGPRHIAEIAEQIRARTDEFAPEARMMLDDHVAFKSFAIALRNLKTAKFDCAYILTKLAADTGNVHLNVTLLEAFYESFDRQYWKIVEPGMLAVKGAIAEIIARTKHLASRVNTNNIADRQAGVIEICANLFAYWTLSYAALSDIEEEQSNYRDTVLKPHAAQVISIFRLLNLDNETSPEFLLNHLVEIGTGEGKSVTMAISAATLALLGFDVDCACYSQYLSRRDFRDFQQLFTDFGLMRFIVYGTFNELCERKINATVNLRHTIEDMIARNASPVAESRALTRRKVIFIDEVDVFFTPDFYGNNYRPLVELRDETITRLVKYIWGIRTNPASLRLTAVKAAAEYQACVARYSNWAALIEESVKAMIVDVQKFDSIECVVVDDKIGYPEQHGVSTDISYGYKTLFAYFEKQESGEITLDSRDARIALILDVGSFSYAEIPKEYAAIIGVTGTLRTLSPPQREILEREYSIQKFSYMPSVYGDENKLDFSGDSPRDVIITQTVGLYNAIVNEISIRRGGLHDPVNRPVMVFFETIAQLMQFYRSGELQRSGYLDKVTIISEQIRDELKQGYIRQATSSGAVTFITRGFGRGTDFRCFDDRINALSGVHVIVTFVSDSLSEEAQLKGRTARQGDKGSFSMVISAEGLERYQIDAAKIARMKATKELYSVINVARNEFFTRKYAEDIRHVKSILEDHQKSWQFMHNLCGGRMDAIREFLIDRNRTVLAAHSDSVSKTIVLMDATGSMSALLNKAKNTVHEMYRRVGIVLSEKGYAASAFELKFVVYRNYSSQGQILVASGWESNADNLERFMATIGPQGGQGNEAIEIGLAHVNLELTKGPLTQVILIGDVPPNTRDEVANRRSGSGGEAYWRITPYSSPTYYLDEINKLKQVPNPPKIHAFYVHPNAAKAFAEIAGLTGGQTGALDIETPAGAEMLTGIVSEAVLHSIGGDSLVMAYREKFGSQKGYVASSARFFPQGGSGAGSPATPGKAAAASAADAQYTP